MRSFQNSLLIVLLFSAGLAGGQQRMTLYNMQDLPERNYLNPALTFNGEAAFGLPVISSVFFGCNNNAFRYSDFVKHSNDDSLYLDANNLLSKLKSENYINTSLESDLFTVHFRVKSSFFSFAIIEKAALHFTFPKEFFEFIWKGNAAFIGEDVSLKSSMNFTHRRDYALTYAYSFKDKFTGGLRLKKLYGMENISVKAAEISFYTNPNTFAISSKNNIAINTSGIESNSFSDFHLSEYLFDRENSGFAADIGTLFRISDRVTVSASVLDVGKMKWKSLTDNYKTSQNSGEFTYNGIDLNTFFADSADAGQVFQQLLDSLTSNFSINQTHKTYETTLPIHFYAGSNYLLNPISSMGVLVHCVKFDDQFHADASISYNRQVGKWLNLACSYSMINKSYFNFGAGVALSLNSFQLYVVSDNVYGTLMPQHSRNINITAGINFLVGRSRD